jgi:acetylornithine deacetylase/succinyl-diaminopimelate desuccinylase-like protein
MRSDSNSAAVSEEADVKQLFLAICVGAVVSAGCATPSGESGPANESAPAAPKLGIRPTGDETAALDVSMVKSPELREVLAHIDANIDEHVVNLQKWIQQPSISNSGEGIPESAEMVKGFWEQLGCQESRVFDVGTTEYGSQGNPVVYAKCDFGAPRTLLIYWMYDTMPVTQPDVWVAPPFEGRLVEQPPFKKVLIARGATNSKGPQMAQFNALLAIKAVTGKLPVNLIFVAEGDEERMDIGLRQFMKTHKELFTDIDALWGDGSQTYSGRGNIGEGNSEGCVYVEITTSGARWGRGPTVSDIHGGNKRSVDSPAWRHIKAIASLVSDDGNTAKIDGFYDDAVKPTPEQMKRYANMAKTFDVEEAAKNLGVARFIHADPLDIIRDRNWISFNLDGIWGGNMYAGGAGAILPNKITSKHNIRYVPNMKGSDLVEKMKKQLVKNGYPDVEVKMIGDVPWRVGKLEGDLPMAQSRAYDIMRVAHNTPKQEETLTGGYWPAYLFGADHVLNVPISNAGVGLGGNAHAANEFYVIEGAGKVYGIAGAEKMQATVLYNFAGKN